jgi:hypothetical protein
VIDRAPCWPEANEQRNIEVLNEPLAEFAGMFKDDPLIKERKKSMAPYRRKVDKDGNKP